MIITDHPTERVSCRLTLHLPTGDVNFQFSHCEDLGRLDPMSMYSFLYCEDSVDILSAEYLAWHNHNIWHGHTPEATSCEMTLQMLDPSGNVASTCRLTDVTPERSFSGPYDDDNPDAGNVLKIIEFRYMDRLNPKP